MSLSYLQQESTPLLPDAVWALSWTSTNHLVSGSADGHVRVWEHTITSLSTSRNGRQTLSTSLDGTISLLDTVEGREIAKIETAREKAAEGHAELPAYSSALHPEGSAMAWSGRSSKVVIRPIRSTEGSDEVTWSGAEGTVVDTGKGKFAMDVQYSPDGRSLAIATEQGQVVVIDSQTQAVVATYASHNKAIRSISWSTDSQWLFSGSDDHLIVLYDVRAGSKSSAGGIGEGAVAMLQGHQSWVLKVEAGPDSKLLGSGGADSLVKIWDIGQRSCVSTSTTDAEVWGFAWQPAEVGASIGKQFAIAGDDKAVTLYRAAGSA